MILLFSLSSVYAEIDDNLDDVGSVENTLTTQIEDNSSCSNLNDELSTQIDNNLSEIDERTHYIDSNNLNSYLNRGVLKKQYADSTLIFSGEFNDKGIITIASPNVQIKGNNALFNNTVFCLDSTNIVLSGLNFVLDNEFYENDYAGILVFDDNNTIINCTMTYTVPDDCYGFCVNCEGSSYYKLNGVQLVNNTFNFMANNLNDARDFCVFLDCVDNAIFTNNTINALLPLRSIDWSHQVYNGARMNYVGGFVADNCENLTLTNNHITTNVTTGVQSLPTLDTVLLYACDNALIEGNYIYSEDFDSKDGKDNYLQGIDLFSSNNVSILNNQIHIRTSGGCENHGTAYPIQVTGPASNITIAFNTLTTVSNGPNLGIYGQNFYGETKLYIISNFINVTGLAGNDSWALVAGIEVQDSEDLIWNNTIIANNIGEYSDDNNVYGISYSQNTKNNHTYNIQHNKVTTNGHHAVSLSGNNSLVVNSIVANNILNSFTYSGNDAVYIGKGSNNSVFNNNINVKESMDTTDLPDWLKKIIRIYNSQSDDSNENGYRINNNSGKSTPSYGNKNSIGLGLNNNGGSGNIFGHNNGLSNANNKTGKGLSNNTNTDSDFIKGKDDGTASKIGGSTTSAKASRSSGSAGSSLKDSKAYEITKQIKTSDTFDEYIKAILLCLVALLLLIVGYKRQDKKEEKKY